MSEKKRKHVVITIEQKLDILQQLAAGVSVNKVANEYNIGKSTIHDIKKNKDKLVKFSMKMSDSVCGIKNRRSMKKSPYELLNRLVLRWFNQERSLGHPVTGPACVQQAKHLHETLGLEGKFDGSSGWLQRFKDRNGIRSVGDTLDCVWTSAVATQAAKEMATESLKLGVCNEGESNNENIQVESGISNENNQAADVRKNKDNLINCSDSEIICEPELHDDSLEKAPHNVEDSPSQASTTREETTTLQLDSSHAEKSQEEIKQTDKTEFLEINSVIKRLEVISEKLTTTALGDSYDQFGKYISSLLRGLPPKKVLSLKQRMVTDVLDVLLAHEKGLPEESLITPCHCSCFTKKRKPNSSLQLPNFDQRQLTQAHISNLSSSFISTPVSVLPSAKESSSNSRIQPFQNDTITTLTSTNVDVRDSPTTSNSSVGASRTKNARKRAQKRKLNKNMEPWCESSDDESNIEIEEGKEYKNINQTHSMFETVFCETNTSDTFVQIKQEVEDPEVDRDLEPDPGLSEDNMIPIILPPPPQLLCDLCSEPCASLQELVVHFSILHPGCVPTVQDQPEEPPPEVPPLEVPPLEAPRPEASPPDSVSAL